MFHLIDKEKLLDKLSWSGLTYWDYNGQTDEMEDITAIKIDDLLSVIDAFDDSEVSLRTEKEIILFLFDLFNIKYEADDFSCLVDFEFCDEEYTMSFWGTEKCLGQITVYDESYPNGIKPLWNRKGIKEESE